MEWWYDGRHESYFQSTHVSWEPRSLVGSGSPSVWKMRISFSFLSSLMEGTQPTLLIYLCSLGFFLRRSSFDLRRTKVQSSSQPFWAATHDLIST